MRELAKILYRDDLKVRQHPVTRIALMLAGGLNGR